MSAESSVIYYLNRPAANDPAEDAEWLFSALGEYTGAELRELLYTAQEPDFFELMRGLFALPEHTRSVLLDFLNNPDTRPVQASIDADGRCTLARGKPEHQGKPTLTIVE
jgi:hypothetical protein